MTLTRAEVEQRWDILAARFAELRPDLIPKPARVVLDMPNFGYETKVYESKEHPGWWIADFDGTEVGFCGENAKENAEKFLASLKTSEREEAIDRALNDKWQPINQFLKESVLWPIYDCRENRGLMAQEVKKLKPPITMKKIVKVFSELVMDGKMKPKPIGPIES